MKLHNSQIKRLRATMLPANAPKTRTPDARYTVNLECCGQPLPQYVARFCGQWIGWADSKTGAIELCHAAYNDRMGGYNHG